MRNFLRRKKRSRRAVSIVLMAIGLVMFVALIAFAIDIGYIVLVRTQLQVAADSAAMAAVHIMSDGRPVATQVARQYALEHVAGGKNVHLGNADIEFGVWDAATRTFTPISAVGNAVRVTARRTSDSDDGQSELFFARVLGLDRFSMTASAIAMANPRDIAFVVDLSGSMNDDTEPQWATGAINSKFAGAGYPTVGADLMQDVYADFGWGTYPGTLEYVAAPLGVASDRYAYAEMTKDDGPLTAGSIPGTCRIVSGSYDPVTNRYTPGDSEVTRKQKAYRWMIDYQIARVMPNARPTPNSAVNYSYWEKYLDYIMRPRSVNHRAPWDPPPRPRPRPRPGPGPPPPEPPPGPPPGPPPPVPPAGSLEPRPANPWEQDGRPVLADAGGLQNMLGMLPGGAWQTTTLPRLLLGAATPPGTPPYRRGTLPPRQDGDRIHKFNNPNKFTFPSASSSVPKSFRNQIGYVTYAAFVMDHGRDIRPNGAQYTPISLDSPDCPLHAESTPGGTFSFPPRSQPMHASRRAIIAAVEYVRTKNLNVPNSGHRDWVSIVRFDALDNGGPVVERPLTGDYLAAMQAATTLQAVGDKGLTTATQSGLAVAERHIRPVASGGQGRDFANKVVVLLTDGVPNLYSTSNGDVDDYMTGNPSADYYGGGYYWLDAALMQAAGMQGKDWELYPVGIGLGTDYDFMDRMARMGGTANDSGVSPRGSGNPAEYEQRLTEIFKEIIDNPSVKLVE